jgi:hypothetical protein
VLNLKEDLMKPHAYSHLSGTSNGINEKRDHKNEFHLLKNAITTVKNTADLFSQSLKPSGFAKSNKMTFGRQEKSRRVTLVGQSHLINPYAAENGLMLLS